MRYSSFLSDGRKKTSTFLRRKESLQRKFSDRKQKNEVVLASSTSFQSLNVTLLFKKANETFIAKTWKICESDTKTRQRVQPRFN